MRSDHNEIDIVFTGEGVAEQGRRTDTGDVVVRVLPQFFRPVDAACLRGDPSKAAAKLNWRAQTTAPELARLMVEAELKRLLAATTPESAAAKTDESARKD